MPSDCSTSFARFAAAHVEVELVRVLHPVGAPAKYASKSFQCIGTPGTRFADEQYVTPRRDFELGKPAEAEVADS